ncbi:hypothetical protein CDL15_Pgr029005 [Punica granatum]|nr:hypothetical protein CDL15_Pgr029005 [Punica granatum]
MQDKIVPPRTILSQEQITANSSQLSLGVDALEPRGVNDNKIECQLKEEAKQQPRANVEDQINADQGVSMAKSKLEDAISSTSSMKESESSKEKPFNVETTPSPTMTPILDSLLTQGRAPEGGSQKTTSL